MSMMWITVHSQQQYLIEPTSMPSYQLGVLLLGCLHKMAGVHDLLRRTAIAAAAAYHRAVVLVKALRARFDGLLEVLLLFLWSVNTPKVSGKNAKSTATSKR